MDNLDSAKEWLHFARMDLESAKHLQGMRPAPFEIICYHCQQSAEKSLKAILIKHQLEVREIHDLVKLIQDVLEVEPDLQALIPVVAGLSDYATITRYPPSMQIGSKEAVRAVLDAEQVLGCCLRTLARGLKQIILPKPFLLLVRMGYTSRYKGPIKEIYFAA
jgi:HEPN domain-containing protein